eukprot:7832359-Pyramimonas_sp.AAC.1
MHAYARGWGATPRTDELLLPVHRTGCLWMVVDGAPSHGPMSDCHTRAAQDARECSWMECRP